MDYKREPIPHTHPCGYCTRLKPCSCDFPASNPGFICDDCSIREHGDPRPPTPLEHHPWLNETDVRTLQAVLYTLRYDQTSRSLAGRLEALIEKVVTS